MYSSTSTRKRSKGSVSVAVSNNRLQLVFRYGGKRNYLSTGLSDTPENRKLAEAKAKVIESDIACEKLDETLEKYKPKQVTTKITTNLAIAQPKSLTLTELLERYIEFKTPIVQKNTIRLYQSAKEHLERFGKPIQNWNDTQLLIQWMRSNKISDTTIHKYFVDYKACVNWGREHALWDLQNPFKYYQKSLKRLKSGEDRRAFTLEQRDAIIKAFQDSRYYKYYAPFVKFRFLTGCRTGEVTGLQWKHVAEDMTSINFCESVVQVGRQFTRKVTKTNEARVFRCNHQMQALLAEIRPENPNAENLVFPGKEGGYLDPKNFCNKAWISVLQSVGMTEENELYAPPYCTRHTFITLCLERGIQPKDLAEWCGTSAQMIHEHYGKKNDSLEVPEF